MIVVWHGDLVTQAARACKDFAPQSRRHEFKDRMHVRDSCEGVKGRVGGHGKEPLDSATIFLQVGFENFGSSVVCHWNDSKLLRASPTPQCYDTGRGRIFRPSRVSATTNKITVAFQFENVDRSCIGFAASSALYLQKVNIGRSDAESGQHTDSFVHQA